MYICFATLPRRQAHERAYILLGVNVSSAGICTRSIRPVQFRRAFSIRRSGPLSRDPLADHTEITSCRFASLKLNCAQNTEESKM